MPPAKASAIARAKAACRRPSCWKSCKFSKAKLISAKIPASPSKPKRPWLTTSSKPSAEQTFRHAKKLADRTAKVVDRIRELPDGEENFPKEIALLTKVNEVMVEATDILAQPETGDPAIAAETEAIELLLRSKRINPKGGGGGGANSWRRRQRNDHSIPPSRCWAPAPTKKKFAKITASQQSIGHTGPTLPEEYRTGLNEYFGKLESGASQSTSADPDAATPASTGENRTKGQRLVMYRPRLSDAYSSNPRDLTIVRTSAG